MPITHQDRLAALAIALQAEREGLERVERSGNCIAADINRERVAIAQKRLAGYASLNFAEEISCNGQS